ncbi:MAG TPA: hypothetical protein VK911_16380 [Vicinamibacterales bacterium]|nr:hypothetical protein [Vicinamibacterales bacterium]
MAGWWSKVEKAIDLAAGVATRRSPESDPNLGTTDEPRGLVGSFEAKMAGVLVSALREAFNRDAARLEAEREQAEHERRRAELALRLEVARQAAEREAARLRAVGVLAIVVWLASLLFVAVHPVDSGAGRVVLALAWACLTAAVAAAFLGYRRVRDTAERVPPLEGEMHPASGRPTPSPPPRFAAADAASWLAVGGLALAAASLLVSM